MLQTPPGGLRLGSLLPGPSCSLHVLLGQVAAHFCVIYLHSEDGRILILELAKVGLFKFSKLNLVLI